MPTFVVLANFTDKGIHEVKDTVSRAEKFKDLATAAGVTIKDMYWTLGASDIIAICEAPDIEIATTLSLSLSARGNVRTQTMPAFSASEMKGILERMA